MTKLYEFTNGSSTFMINLEHVTAITKSSGDGVIITTLNGTSYNIKANYEELKKFLELQQGIITRVYAP